MAPSLSSLPWYSPPPIKSCWKCGSKCFGKCKAVARETTNLGATVAASVGGSGEEDVLAKLKANVAAIAPANWATRAAAGVVTNVAQNVAAHVSTRLANKVQFKVISNVYNECGGKCDCKGVDKSCCKGHVE